MTRSGTYATLYTSATEPRLENYGRTGSAAIMLVLQALKMDKSHVSARLVTIFA